MSKRKMKSSASLAELFLFLSFNLISGKASLTFFFKLKAMN